MRRFYRIMVMLVAAVAFVLPNAFAQPSPSRTKESVVQVADAFLKGMGAEVATPTKVVYPAPNRYPDELEYHWQPRWLLEYADGALIEVVDATGVVSRYRSPLDSASSKVADSAKYIRQEKALAIARHALSLSGQPVAELGNISATVDTMMVNDQRLDPQWRIEWTRQFKGIPCYDQQVVAYLDAETGVLRTFIIRFITPLPTVTQSISRNAMQAASIAYEYLDRYPFSELTCLDIYPAVVPERDFAPKSESGLPFWRGEQPVAHFAWVIKCHYFDYADCYVEVWVDKDTGKIVGGENARPRGPGTKAPEHLSDVLKQAKEVRLFTRGEQGTWKRTPAAVLSTDKLALLQSAKDVAAPSSKHPVARVKAEVPTADGKTATLFLSTTGEVIGFGQQAKLPPALARWVNTLATPKPH